MCHRNSQNSLAAWAVGGALLVAGSPPSDAREAHWIKDHVAVDCPVVLQALARQGGELRFMNRVSEYDPHLCDVGGAVPLGTVEDMEIVLEEASVYTAYDARGVLSLRLASVLHGPPGRILSDPPLSHGIPRRLWNRPYGELLLDPDFVGDLATLTPAGLVPMGVWHGRFGTTEGDGVYLVIGDGHEGYHHHDLYLRAKYGHCGIWAVIGSEPNDQHHRWHALGDRDQWIDRHPTFSREGSVQAMVEHAEAFVARFEGLLGQQCGPVTPGSAVARGVPPVQGAELTRIVPTGDRQEAERLERLERRLAALQEEEVARTEQLNELDRQIDRANGLADNGVAIADDHGALLAGTVDLLDQFLHTVEYTPQEDWDSGAWLEQFPDVQVPDDLGSYPRVTSRGKERMFRTALPDGVQSLLTDFTQRRLGHWISAQELVGRLAGRHGSQAAAAMGRHGDAMVQRLETWRRALQHDEQVRRSSIERLQRLQWQREAVQAELEQFQREVQATEEQVRAQRDRLGVPSRGPDGTRATGAAGSGGQTAPSADADQPLGGSSSTGQELWTVPR